MNEFLADHSIPGGGIVRCACSVAGSVWLAVGCALWKATFFAGELVVSPLAADSQQKVLVVCF